MLQLRQCWIFEPPVLGGIKPESCYRRGATNPVAPQWELLVLFLFLFLFLVLFLVLFLFFFLFFVLFLVFFFFFFFLATS